MKIFGYGSLLCEDSFRSTTSQYKVLGPATLTKYKRVFCVQSPYRKDSSTGTPASVLNIVKDASFNIMGVLYEVPEHELEKLHLREKGYDLVEIELIDGQRAFTYIHPSSTCYHYRNGDAKQEEYLTICLKAAKKLGEEVYNNFLDTTFIGESTIRKYVDI